MPVIGGHASIEAGRVLSDTPLLRAILEGNYAPFLTHLLLSLLFIVPMTYSLITKRISHVCNIKITAWLVAFGAFLVGSIFFSSFWLVSIQSVLDWALMSSVFFAVALCCGRRMSIFPLTGYAVGTTLAALLGIVEYGAEKGNDPGWRIFALQVGPNQAGAVFAIGFCLCLGLSLLHERLPRLGFVLAAFLNGLALALTQSKGAFLCLPVGLVVLVLALLWLKPIKPMNALGVVALGLLLFAGGFGFAVKGAQAQAGAGASGALTRISNTSEASVQSTDFRKLLWLSAIDLAKAKPQGWGAGTFWYESTRPGRTTQTTLAHQTFLQLAAESTVFAPLALIGFLGSVAIIGYKGARQLSTESRVILASATGAMGVAIAHNFFDSDMYVFGLGALVFLLAGAVVSTSADSQAPEYVFRAPKVGFLVSVCALIPLCGMIGMAELNRAQARGAMEERNGTAMLAHAEAAMSLAFADGQAAALKALATRSEDDLLTAVRFHPSPKAYRALADHYLVKQDYQACFRALNRALDRDPNNASALKKYYETASAAGDLKLAKEYAERLVETEKTTYFQVRSQPEFIPLQTYEARVFLAEQPENKSKRIDLLREAYGGYRQYRDKTVPTVLRMMGGNKKVSIAGEDMQSLHDNIEEGKRILGILKESQRSDLGLEFDAEFARFAEVLELLNK